MTYKIVCFCGGGIRGLLSAKILENLAAYCPKILTNTDLFAGTSTGSGIISWLLAGKKPTWIVNEGFLNQEFNFFSNPSTPPSADSPAYSIDDVVTGQWELHQDKMLSDFEQQSVLFTAFNVGSVTEPPQGPIYTPWSPVLFSNLPNSPNRDTMIKIAVASSSAMPGMLGSCNGNIDGAFVNHDPTLAAIAMAIDNYPKLSLSDIVVICIGTGLMTNWIASDTHDWGAHQWQNGDGNSNNNTPALLVRGSVSPILNAVMNGTSVSLVPELAGMMLQGNYANLNPPVRFYIPENDVRPGDLKYLQEQAADCDPQQMSNAKSLLDTYWAQS